MTEARLAEKVCLVTGGGAQSSSGPAGNGQAVAVRFAQAGASVLVVDIDAAAGDRTVAQITQAGGDAHAFTADLTRGEDAAAMVDAAVTRWGRIDVLHNNVGITSSGSVVDTSEEDWDRVMRVNVRSMMLASKHAVPVMAEGGGGSIVTISSVGALRPRGLTAYTTSKGAVIALTRAMAVDHGPQGIRANCIAPGPLYTPHAAVQGMTPEDRDRRRRASLLNVEGTAWDVAEAALFLASDESRYITGIVLPVDGGVSVGSPAR